MMSFRAAYHPQIESFDGPFKVNVIGCRVPMKGMVNVPQGHPTYFFHYFHDPVLAKLNGRWLELPADTMLPVYPDYPLINGLNKGTWRRSWLRCSGTHIEAILKKYRIQNSVPIHMGSFDLCERWFLNIHNEIHASDTPDADTLEDMFAIWVRLLSKFVNEEQGEKTPSEFLKVRQFCEREFLLPISLSGLCDRFGISRSHLCKGFNKYFNTTPIDYVIELRLQHAIELMADADLKLAEIANQSGFKDIYFFSKTFKKRLGVSPSRYRKTS